MDSAVGLVQAYLRVNGFFTVTEYPIVAELRHGARMLTDVDIMAMRFPGAERWIPEGSSRGHALPSDPGLSIEDEGLQMIIGEVKEGKARLNQSALSLPVVEAVIRRFGCCAHDPAATARKVVRNGSATTVVGDGMPCRIRIIVFGGATDETGGRYEVISLKHVITYLSRYLDQYRDVFLSAQFKDQALGLMALLVKLDLKL